MLRGLTGRAHIEETPMLAIGDIAPATEMATDADRFSLAPHDGKKMVIFFFLAKIHRIERFVHFFRYFGYSYARNLCLSKPFKTFDSQK